MSDLADRIAALSPIKVDLLLRVCRGFAPDPGGSTDVATLPRDGGPYPASFAQERMWFLDQLSPGNPAYNLMTLHRLPRSVDVVTVRAALDELVLRHEALRTVFRPIKGRPAQVILSVRRAAFETLDLSRLSSRERQIEAQRAASEEAGRCFDLATGPLFRSTLLDLGEQGYVLMLALHHIIADAWSLSVLQRELGLLYGCGIRGAKSRLPALRIQYVDFAAWQRDRLSDRRLDALISHWKSTLAGAPFVTELPLDRPRPRVRTHRGAVHAFTVDRATATRLGTLARDEGATLFMALLTIYAELLRRLTGQSEVLVGTPVTNRNRAELERIVGLFVNTVVLRLRLSPTESFRESLRRIREVTLDAHAHQELPFERLVDELQPERDLACNPLVQVTFGLHHANPKATDPFERKPSPMSAGESSGLPDRTNLGSGNSGEPVFDGSNGTAKFDLSLVLNDEGEQLQALFEYSAELFDPATISRAAAYFCSLLHAAALEPELPLAAASLISQAEGSRIVSTLAVGPKADVNHGISEDVASWARRTPARPAIEGPETSCSYGLLHEHANALAYRLIAAGVGAECRVGVLLSVGSVHAPLAFLAILRAGGAYVPLDPTLPTERLRFIVADAGVKVLVSDGAYEPLFADSPLEVIDLTRIDTGIAPRRLPNIDDDQLSYVIYTSGSTGVPKGTALTHRGLRSLIAAQRQALGVIPSDRVLRFAAPGFDASIFEMTLALAAGATLCLEESHRILPGAELLETLRQRRISIVTLPPSSAAVIPSGDCPDLRLLVVAGEACSAAIVARWAKGRRMVNAYGPTETTVWASYHDCKELDQAIAIGRPIANVAIYVLDAQMQPAPIGVPGELWIAGPTLARGYLGRADLTAAAFLPNPWGAPGSRLYRTGDIARWRNDGVLDFIRRNDQQIKIRGFRVELTEIEAALELQPEVAYCSVTLRDGTASGEQMLVAYVVPRDEAKLDPVSMRRRLEERLPRYMIPRYIVPLRELPRTASGKVDRRALPVPSVAIAAKPTPPGNSIEETVCRLCAEVLATPVGPEDNFFELGGHSLLATQLLSRLQLELGVDIPIRNLFESATLADLCRTLDVVQCAPASPIKRLSRMPAQAREWLTRAARARTEPLSVAGHTASSRTNEGIQ